MTPRPPRAVGPASVDGADQGRFDAYRTSGRGPRADQDEADQDEADQDEADQDKADQNERRSERTRRRFS